MPSFDEAIKDVDTKEKNKPKVMSDINKKKLIYLNFSTNHKQNYYIDF